MTAVTVLLASLPPSPDSSNTPYCRRRRFEGMNFDENDNEEQKLFVVGGVPLYRAIGGLSMAKKRCVERRLSMHANNILGTIYQGLYQHDFGVINETDLCLTVWRELCGKDLQSCFTHLIQTTSCGPLAGILPASLSGMVCIIAPRNNDKYKYIRCINSG